MMWSYHTDDDEIPVEPLSGPDKTGFRSAWANVFQGSAKQCLSNLRKMAFAGEIGDCPYRSVVWKVLLGVISPNPRLWMHESSVQRNRYEKLRIKYERDISPDNGDGSVSKVNSMHSSYTDDELRRDIKQDVVRTFPERLFFTDPKIVSMMCAILFVYAKENVDILYKQGMHELLAIVIYVLHEDHSAFKRCVKSKTKMSERVHTVLRGSHLEHDAFTIFSKIMLNTKVWYEYRDSAFQSFKWRFSQGFQNGDLENNSPAIKKINTIWEKKVKQFDPELYHKLNSLDIQPHFFSLRWLRLIFARELVFDEVLSLWDAIFAYDDDLSFVDSVYCAILFSIRTELVEGDHSTCLQSLMKHPKSLSTFKIIPWALYIADTTKSPRPLDFVDRSHWGKLKKANKYAAPKTGRSYSLSNLLSAVMGSGKGANTDPAEEMDSSIEGGLKSARTMNDRPQKPQPPNPITKSHHVSTYQMSSSSPIVNSPRNQELMDRCNYCSGRLEVFIQSLHEVLQEEKLQNDEKVLVSIAGLKQIRDILNGAIKIPVSPTGKPDSKDSTPTNLRNERKNSEMVELFVETEESAGSPVTADQKVVLDGSLKDSPESSKSQGPRPESSRSSKIKPALATNGTAKKLLLPDKSLTAAFSPAVSADFRTSSSSSSPFALAVSKDASRGLDSSIDDSNWFERSWKNPATANSDQLNCNLSGNHSEMD